jgi:hypothetical protein
MPRHPRLHARGLLYHLMARGNNGQQIFPRNSDFVAFLDALTQVRPNASNKITARAFERVIADARWQEPALSQKRCVARGERRLWSQRGTFSFAML